jgi:hypothetical protein
MGTKGSKKDRKMLNCFRNTGKMVENGQKRSKMVENGRKMSKMGNHRGASVPAKACLHEAVGVG